MSEVSTASARSTWGRSRLGGGSAALIASSLAIGAVASAAFGLAIRYLAAGDHPRPWLLFATGALLILPVMTAAAWAMLVDRSTLAGAPDDPESSIEGRWYDKAAAGAYHLMLATLGVGAGVFTFVRVDISPSLLLLGCFVIAVAALCVNYLLAKGAGS